MTEEDTPVAHTDHPLRHFDRTCPGCIAAEGTELGCDMTDRKLLEAIHEKICEAIGGSPEDGRPPEAVALEIFNLCRSWAEERKVTT